MELIFLTTVLVVELAKYWISLTTFLQVKIKKTAVLISVIPMMIFLIVNRNQNETMILGIILFGVITIFGISMEGSIFQKIKLLLITIFWITCLDEFVGILVDYSFIQLKWTSFQMNISHLAGSMGCLLLIILIRFIKNRKVFQSERILNFARKSIVPVMILSSIFLTFAITGFNTLRSYISNEVTRIVITIVCAIAFICILILISSVIYIIKTNEKVEKLMESERSMKEMQLDYYKKMLDREEDTRRYRHDINNHLICIDALAKKGETKSIETYVSNMYEKMETSTNHIYQIGNEIVDAILTYHLSTLPNDTKIELVGKWSREVNINNVDLCVIFSNILQNATEELNRITSGEKLLRMELSMGRDYLRIEIINTISTESRGKSESLKTKKKDIKNHGIGIQNVKDTINNIGGYFTTKISEDKFYTEISLELNK